MYVSHITSRGLYETHRGTHSYWRSKTNKTLTSRSTLSRAAYLVCCLQSVCLFVVLELQCAHICSMCHRCSLSRHSKSKRSSITWRNRLPSCDCCCTRSLSRASKLTQCSVSWTYGMLLYRQQVSGALFNFDCGVFSFSFFVCFFCVCVFFLCFLANLPSVRSIQSQAALIKPTAVTTL